jgi:hypothetical protein
MVKFSGAALASIPIISDASKEIITIKAASPTSTGAEAVVIQGVRNDVVLSVKGKTDKEFTLVADVPLTWTYDENLFNISGVPGLTNMRDILEDGYRWATNESVYEGDKLIGFKRHYTKYEAEIEVYHETQNGWELKYSDDFAYITGDTVVSKQPMALLKALFPKAQIVLVDNEYRLTVHFREISIPLVRVDNFYFDHIRSSSITALVGERSGLGHRVNYG